LNNFNLISTHSGYQTGNTVLDGKSGPQAGSPAIDNGTPLLSYFSTDFIGFEKTGSSREFT